MVVGSMLSLLVVRTQNSKQGWRWVSFGASLWGAFVSAEPSRGVAANPGAAADSAQKRSRETAALTVVTLVAVWPGGEDMMEQL